ncbi:MAG: 2-hydroxyacyl-CoA dehydratase [Dehalococcoidia bacterium]|nr:MAG: 2-hydroxyacyl-CoA dehydratase [Dehalococcoidia bacterium]
MSTSNSKGLARVEELYEHRNSRAEELKAQGKKVIGYFCCLAPVEMIAAAGLVPVRILGDVKEPITRADAHLENIACPFARSCLDIALKGRYDFIDGLVVPHTCDNIYALYGIWASDIVPITPSYSYFIDSPHMTFPTSFEYFEVELGRFRTSLENYTGSKITDGQLNDAIELYNRNRSLLRELYELRKQSPPLLSGTEMTKVLVAIRVIPVEESNELLEQVIEEVKNRPNPTSEKTRLLVYGGEIDSIALIELIEESGANVVVDDHCLGVRCFWHDVKANGNPLRSISDRYLGEVACPRTYWQRTGSYKEDMDNRFGYLMDFAREYNVKGVILYVVRYCDTFELDAPGVRDYFQDAGIPVLHIEDDYSTTTIGQLRTRVQAFLEMID